MFGHRRFWLGRPPAKVEMAGGVFALTTDMQVRQLAALAERTATLDESFLN